MDEDNALVDYECNRGGWSPDFSAWYDERRETDFKESQSYFNEEASNEEFDEEIQNELEGWND